MRSGSSHEKPSLTCVQRRRMHAKRFFIHSHKMLKQNAFFVLTADPMRR
jgi:hypothetical protein